VCERLPTACDPRKKRRTAFFVGLGGILERETKDQKTSHGTRKIPETMRRGRRRNVKDYSKRGGGGVKN